MTDSLKDILFFAAVGVFSVPFILYLVWLVRVSRGRI